MKRIKIDKLYLENDLALSTLSSSELDELIEKLNECKYDDSSTAYGYFCYCPICNKHKMTSRCACMCGSCKTCGYRWNCYSGQFSYEIEADK